MEPFQDICGGASVSVIASGAGILDDLAEALTVAGAALTLRRGDRDPPVKRKAPAGSSRSSPGTRAALVLMLAWANQEALAATRATGFAHHGSRSRKKKLWKK